MSARRWTLGVLGVVASILLVGGCICRIIEGLEPVMRVTMHFFVMWPFYFAEWCAQWGGFGSAVAALGLLFWIVWRMLVRGAD
jgi:hypothetical protein